MENDQKKINKENIFKAIDDISKKIPSISQEDKERIIELGKATSAKAQENLGKIVDVSKEGYKKVQRNAEVLIEKGKAQISEEDISKTLDWCYDKCLNGIPQVDVSIYKLADDYLSKYNDKETACKKMLENQVLKCTTSGFLTGLGGIATMPVTIPANLTSVLYVQMRMIACTAYMAGFELRSDQTQTFTYACLAGVAINDFVKQFGVKLGVKAATASIKKIPGKALTAINQKVGFRLITKFGQKGLLNLGKMVPVVGGVIGGGMDAVETSIIANRAYHWFMEGNFESQDKDIVNFEDIVVSEDDIVDAE